MSDDIAGQGWMTDSPGRIHEQSSSLQSHDMIDELRKIHVDELEY